MSGPDEEMSLVITMSANRQISVTGPIGNKILCYGMLEAAKDAIHDFVEKGNESRIALPGAIKLPVGH